MRYKISKYLKIAPLIIIPVLLSLLWFRDGAFIAGGEDSLSIWNSSKMLHIFSSSWFDIGLGGFYPFWIPRIPTFFISSLLSSYFSYSIVQGILFGFLLFAGGLGMYTLAKYFSKDNYFVSMLAGTFYILNLYTLSQVWSRFIYTGFFAWAYLPLFLYLWIKWLESASYKYLVYFVLSSILFSGAFTHPAFIFTLWSTAILFSLIKIFSSSLTFRNKMVYLVRTLFGIICWAIFNIWWLFPYAKMQTYVVSMTHDWKYDLESLKGASSSISIIDILLLRHKFYFGMVDYWGNFYKSTFSYLISFSILVVTFFGLVKAKVIKNPKFLWILALISFFVCKGTNSPFGNAIFSFLFQYIPLARAFRNSYEKFGSVWLLTYSILFAYGFYFIYQKLSRVWRFVLIAVFIPLFMVVLVWPMWLNRPFSPWAAVYVPDNYKLADNYIESLSKDGRILSLPIIPGEGVKYNWQNSSYMGLEPSDFLFTKPVISKTIGDRYADEKYMELYNAFVAKKGISQLLDQTDVEFLVLHNEMEPKYSGASSSAEVKETLKKYPEIKFLKSIGFLDIYKNTNYLSDSRIVIEGGVFYSYQEINPGHYTVEIKNAEKPFKLILKTSFSPLWMAKTGKDVISDHSVIYGYANGWTIDKNGSYSIDLVFKIWPDIFSGTQ